MAPDNKRLVETVSEETDEILKRVKSETGETKKDFLDRVIRYGWYYLQNEGTKKDTICEVDKLRRYERDLSDAINDHAPAEVIDGLRATIKYQRQVIFNLKEPAKDGK